MKMAYLILAHRDDRVFRTLLQMLDSEENDIFIHMDRKNSSYSPESVEKSLQKSRVFHIPRISVSWGGYSMVRAEMNLLKAAMAQGDYDYCHLLSGGDLPIKPQSQIRCFFEENRGKEFVSFDGPEFRFPERVRYRYRLQEITGRTYGYLFRLQEWDVALQKRLGLERNRAVEFQKGSNWFSITGEFARYAVQQEKWVRKVFSQGLCVDELFLQTVLLNSPFRDRRHQRQRGGDPSMRCIDWKRGAPYTFRSEDFDLLMDSPMLFARKFDAEVDCEIVKRIGQACSE